MPTSKKQKKDLFNRVSKDTGQRYRYGILAALLRAHPMYYVLGFIGIALVFIAIASLRIFDHAKLFRIFAMLQSFFILMILLNTIYYNPVKVGLVQLWSREVGLYFSYKKARERIKERFLQNPGKHFFGFRGSPFMVRGMHPVYFVGGAIQNRQVYLYPIVTSISGQKFSQSGYQSWHRKNARTFVGVCMEIGTHRLPVDVTVSRGIISAPDDWDTESNAFERGFQINSPNRAGMLQLLDPVMMDLVHHAAIAGLEFSDRSVALYHVCGEGFWGPLAPDREKLNSMLYWGMKIAEQAGRNYPMGKYEKS